MGVGVGVGVTMGAAVQQAVKEEVESRSSVAVEGLAVVIVDGVGVAVVGVAKTVSNCCSLQLRSESRQRKSQRSSGKGRIVIGVEANGDMKFWTIFYG